MRRTWLFDLDNTLHDANPHIFPHINRAMTDYLVRHLDLTEPEANGLRVRYWLSYGATLTGLMRHHGTDPHHFLWHTHQFPDLRRMVVFDRPLRAMLTRLPGDKIVFSNAPRHYTEAVLDLLGIGRLFRSVWSIERLRFVPKPKPEGFHRLLRAEGLHPARCIMVEDSPANLRTAKRLGMRTVLVSSNPRRPAGVDLRIESVLQLPRHLGKL